MPIQFFEATGQTISGSPYRALRFPAGEAHVVAPAERTSRVQIAWVQPEDANTLFELAMWADAVSRNGGRAIALMPYLPGARQDRGRPLGAKVYADFINAMGLEQIVCFDAHSDVMPALLDHCTAVPLDTLPQWTDGTYADVVGVIAPDAGARKRAESVAAVMGKPVYQAYKHRDFATGKLSGFACEPPPDSGRLLVVDDICDGGGTFAGLAEATGLDRERLALWVSHGVFSRRAVQLPQHFAHIATTDSHPGHAGGIVPEVAITPLFDHLISFANIEEALS